VSPAEPVPAVREVEHRFRVHGLYRIADLTDPDLVSAVEDRSAVELETAYYDTPNLRLVREGMTLRRRAGESDEGWHLKLPVPGAGAEVRDEIRPAPVLAANADAPASFTLGVLYAAERERIAATRRQFEKLWPRVSRRKWRRWLAQ